MKARSYTAFSLGLVLSALPFVGGCTEQSADLSSSLVLSANAEPLPAAISTNPPVETPPPSATQAELGPAEDVDAIVAVPAPGAAAEKKLPANIKPTPPTTEVIKLAQAGVDEAVMLNYITNATSLFVLNSDDIIYFNDLGVAGNIVTAMMQHDQELKAAGANPVAQPSQFAEQAAAPTYVNPPQPEPQPPPLPAQVEAAPPPPAANVTDNYLNDSLSPYGTWVEVEGYGRCWQPTVVVANHGWRPYCDGGRWIYTDHGWYWYSDYSWGAAAFHYGRWFSHPRYGWCWWPDTVWAPSWVTFRYSGDYCGWAPLPPLAYYNSGVGFSYYGQSVGFSFGFGLSSSCYTFVSWNRFCDNRPWHHRVPAHDVARVYNHTTVHNHYVIGNNNTVINRGISAEQYRDHTRTELRSVTLHEGRGGTQLAGRSELLGTDRRTLVVNRPRDPGPGVSPRPISASQTAGTPAAGSRSGRPGGSVAVSPSPWRERGGLVEDRNSSQLADNVPAVGSSKIESRVVGAPPDRPRRVRPSSRVRPHRRVRWSSLESAPRTATIPIRGDPAQRRRSEATPPQRCEAVRMFNVLPRARVPPPAERFAASRLLRASRGLRAIARVRHRRIPLRRPRRRDRSSVSPPPNQIVRRIPRDSPRRVSWLRPRVTLRAPAPDLQAMRSGLVDRRLLRLRTTRVPRLPRLPRPPRRPRPARLVPRRLSRARDLRPMGARNLVAGTGHNELWSVKSFQPMKPDGFLLRCVLGACLLSPAAFTANAALTNVFSTQFESAEGYDPALDLVGQLGWDGSGTGGNGLASGFITNRQQHAYIGYAAPLSTNEDQLLVWQPINFNPLAANRPIVTFSTLMQISDSENVHYDNFRWSFYNTQVHRLFSIDFDNSFQDVNYLLDGTNKIVVPGFPLANDFTYTLVVTMNFASNRWSATLNGAPLATNQPITTTGALLDLGDVDAVWLIANPTAPGDNLMVFDDYRITAESIPVPPAQIHFLGRTSQSWSLLQVSGLNGSRWSVDATTNLVNWTALKTNTISETFFDFVDTTAAGLPRRFYRARLVP